MSFKKALDPYLYLPQNLLHNILHECVHGRDLVEDSKIN